MLNFKKICHASLTTIMLVGLFSTQAQAQSGSRLCGHVAVDTPTKIGLLYEARDNDASYHKQCDEAISKTQDAINKNAQLKSMQWKTIKRWKCEEVGNLGFVNKGESADICDKMEAKVPYKVVKQPNASATYTKQ